MEEDKLKSTLDDCDKRMRDLERRMEERAAARKKAREEAPALLGGSASVTPMSAAGGSSHHHKDASSLSSSSEARGASPNPLSSSADAHAASSSHSTASSFHTTSTTKTAASTTAMTSSKGAHTAIDVAAAAKHHAEISDDHATLAPTIVTSLDHKKHHNAVLYTDDDTQAAKENKSKTGDAQGSQDPSDGFMDLYNSEEMGPSASAKSVFRPTIISTSSASSSTNEPAPISVSTASAPPSTSPSFPFSSSSTTSSTHHRPPSATHAQEPAKDASSRTRFTPSPALTVPAAPRPGSGRTSPAAASGGVARSTTPTFPRSASSTSTFATTSTTSATTTTTTTTTAAAAAAASTSGTKHESSNSSSASSSAASSAGTSAAGSLVRLPLPTAASAPALALRRSPSPNSLALGAQAASSAHAPAAVKEKDASDGTHAQQHHHHEKDSKEQHSSSASSGSGSAASLTVPGSHTLASASAATATTETTTDSGRHSPRYLGGKSMESASNSRGGSKTEITVADSHLSAGSQEKRAVSPLLQPSAVADLPLDETTLSQHHHHQKREHQHGHHEHGQDSHSEGHHSHSKSASSHTASTPSIVLQGIPLADSASDDFSDKTDLHVQSSRSDPTNHAGSTAEASSSGSSAAIRVRAVTMDSAHPRPVPVSVIERLGGEVGESVVDEEEEKGGEDGGYGFGDMLGDEEGGAAAARGRAQTLDSTMARHKRDVARMRKHRPRTDKGPPRVALVEEEAAAGASPASADSSAFAEEVEGGNGGTRSISPRTSTAETNAESPLHSMGTRERLANIIAAGPRPGGPPVTKPRPKSTAAETGAESRSRLATWGGGKDDAAAKAKRLAESAAKSRGASQAGGNSLAFMLNQQAIHGAAELKSTGAKIVGVHEPKLVRTHAEKEPILLRMRGRRFVCTTSMPISTQSLNSGDAFVLDATSTVYVWVGANCTLPKRTRSQIVSIAIKDREYGGRIDIVQLEQGDTSRPDKGFWKALGADGPPQRIAEGGDDEAFETQYLQQLSLLRLSESGAATVVASGRDVKRTLLADDGVFFLDAGPDSCVWLGRFATMTKEAAQGHADALSKKRGGTGAVRVVRQGTEPAIFMEQFADRDLVHALPREATNMAEPPAVFRSRAQTQGPPVAARPAAPVRPKDVTMLPLAALREYVQKGHFPSGIHKANLEWHLSDQELEALFGMPRTAFDAMPAWKRTQARQAAGLF